jgi:hypothetical protein
MRHIATLILACGMATVVTVSAGSQGAPRDDVQQKSDLVTVRGCLNGRTLVALYGTGSITPQRYELTGDRETMKALKAHSSHVEEITGTLKTRDPKGATHTTEKQSGKNRVYFGVAEAKPSDAPSPAAGPVIAVRSMKHLNEHCGSSGS